ncbi:MAG: hypothetical protein AB7V39_00380 [Nitrospiraceae bacterium]
MSVKWIQERPDGKRALYTFSTMNFLALCSEANFYGCKLDDPRMEVVFKQFLDTGRVKAYRLTHKTSAELQAEIKRNFPGYIELGPKEEGNGE